MVFFTIVSSRGMSTCRVTAGVVRLLILYQIPELLRRHPNAARADEYAPAYSPSAPWTGEVVTVVDLVL